MLVTIKADPVFCALGLNSGAGAGVALPIEAIALPMLETAIVAKPPQNIKLQDTITIMANKMPLVIVQAVTFLLIVFFSVLLLFL